MIVGKHNNIILLAFSGLAHNNGTMDRQSGKPLGVANMIVGKHNNITTLNTQEMHDLQEFMKYNLIHYGLHSGKLDKLQYKADMNFLTWYIGNFNRIPSAYRGITQQNASVMLPIWENESLQAQSDVQAVANYEVNQHTSQYRINTAYIVNNHLGNLVSNRTTMYNNESANLLVYKYTKDNESLVYELIDQKGSFIPVDPYIRLNAFTIHWGWGGLISGTSYNIYFTFTNYNNALSFKDVLSDISTIQASVDAAVSILASAALGAAIGSVIPGAGTLAGAIVGVVLGVAKVLVDNTNPVNVANTINGLFRNQEDYTHDKYFNITYTYNAWEWGLVPEFSWWGYMNPGSVLTQIYKDVSFGHSDEEEGFMMIYNSLANTYGTNVEMYFGVTQTWATIADIVGGWITSC
jgi:hypothetical protein